MPATSRVLEVFTAAYGAVVELKAVAAATALGVGCAASLLGNRL
jgi:hypothetical protein